MLMGYEYICVIIFSLFTYFIHQYIVLLLDKYIFERVGFETCFCYNKQMNIDCIIFIIPPQRRITVHWGMLYNGEQTVKSITPSWKRYLSASKITFWKGAYSTSNRWDTAAAEKEEQTLKVSLLIIE